MGLPHLQIRIRENYVQRLGGKRQAVFYPSEKGKGDTMKKGLLRITSLLMAACTLLSAFSMNASALSWDGSSAGGGGEGGVATTKGFSIRYTDDRNCLGYRFSVVDKAGGTRNGLSIDVYRNISNANSEFNTAYKYTVKYNKKQFIDNQNSGFSTSKNTNNCYKEADMGFASALPVPSGMETWQNNAVNLNAILSKLKIGSVNNLKNGDKILVEPLYNVRLQTIYHSVTTTELAISGKWLLGANSDGGSSGNSDTWGFISAYTNRYYPNALYTPDGQGLWTGVSALTKRATFYDIINKGYGVGIAYTETRPDFTPSLKVNVCEAWKGTKSTRSFHYGTSNGSAFSNYSYDKGYPIKGDTVWFTVNFPAESQNTYVRQSVRLQGGSWTSRNIYSSSGTWYDVALSPTTVDAGRSSYVVEAKVDWIDSSGKVLKYGAVKTFYIPVRPKINRYQVTMYDYSENVAAKGGSGGHSGAVYVGQKTYPQYTFTSENPWTSSNNFRGSLLSWKSSGWSGSSDLSANSVGINKDASYTRNSSLYPYRVADNSGSGSSLIPFDLTSQWTQDTAHTTETTRINIPVVKADVELTNIRLIGENGYYVTSSTLWAHQTVTPQYTYRNNTSVRVYIEAYNHDQSKKDGAYAIDPGESINVNGKPVTVPQGNSFSVWGGVYLEGAGLGNTSWESNGSNNAWSKSWTVKNPLAIEAVTPNAIYREGTQVISSFKVVNAYSSQFIPGSGISVKFTAKSGGRTLYTTTKTGVVVPGNNEQLVYFKWTVPSGLNGASVTVQGDVVDNGITVDTAAQNVSTGKVVDSQTPDTDYEESKPAGWSQASKPSPSSTQATWSEWVYANGAFQKKTYGMKITQNTVTLAPDSGSPSAEMVNGVWQLKSGYGLTAAYTPSFSSVSGTLMPSSSAYTAVQHGYMQFPEFRYSSANGQYRTLQKVGSSFQFAVNPAADGGRVHFIPVWYPDGSYQASCYVYDCWTPAGMIAARLDTNQLTISGSLYDDWYVGREG